MDISKFVKGDQDSQLSSRNGIKTKSNRPNENPHKDRDKSRSDKGERKHRLDESVEDIEIVDIPNDRSSNKPSSSMRDQNNKLNRSNTAISEIGSSRSRPVVQKSRDLADKSDLESVVGSINEEGEVFNIGNTHIVKEDKIGAPPERPLYQPRKNARINPDVDFGLNLLTNNKIKDVSDLSSEEIIGKQRKKPVIKKKPQSNYGEDMDVDTEDEPFQRHQPRKPSNEPREHREYREHREEPIELELKLDDGYLSGDVSSDLSNMPRQKITVEDKRGHNDHRFRTSPNREADMDSVHSNKGDRFMDWLEPSDLGQGSPEHNGFHMNPPEDEYQEQSLVPSEREGDDEERYERREKLSPHEIYLKKKAALKRIERLRVKGYTTSKRFTQNSSLNEILDELEALEEERSLDQSIRAQQKIIMGASTGLELLNKLYNPLDLELDGFSENIYENIGDYDEVFEELHEKYKDQVSIPPEIKLLMMFFGSAVLFHFSKNVFNDAKSKVPQFDDIMSKNPDLREAYRRAAMQEAGGPSPASYPSNYPPPPNNGHMGNLSNILQMFGGQGGGIGNMLNMFMGNGQRGQQMPMNPQQAPNMHSMPQPQQMPMNQQHRMPQQPPQMPQPQPQRMPQPQMQQRPQPTPQPQYRQQPINPRQNTTSMQTEEIAGPDHDDILGGGRAPPANNNRLEDIDGGSDDTIKSIQVTGRRTKKSKRDSTNTINFTS